MRSTRAAILVASLSGVLACSGTDAASTQGARQDAPTATPIGPPVESSPTAPAPTVIMPTATTPTAVPRRWHQLVFGSGDEKHTNYPEFATTRSSWRVNWQFFDGGHPASADTAFYGCQFQIEVWDFYKARRAAGTGKVDEVGNYGKGSTVISAKPGTYVLYVYLDCPHEAYEPSWSAEVQQ